MYVRFYHEGLVLMVGIHSDVGGSILEMMRSSLATSETADALAVQVDEESSGMESVEYVDFNYVHY